VDGDGLDEVLIGASWRNQYRGEAYLIRGSETGWAPGTDLSTADASFAGEDAYDYAGFSLASGDIDGDGNSDLLISAAYDSDAASNAGQTYLVLAPTALPIPALPGWGPEAVALALLAAGAARARRFRQRRLNSGG
jgi:hypothetical protein